MIGTRKPVRYLPLDMPTVVSTYNTQVSFAGLMACEMNAGTTTVFMKRIDIGW